MTLPFLTPLIPPVGISCLKSYLQTHGYRVKTVDTMQEMSVRECCYHYFETLKSFIPEEKRGYYFNVALDVMNNHFMAYVNAVDQRAFNELVKELVYRNFFVTITRQQVLELNSITARFYEKLDRCILDLVEAEKPGMVGLSVYKGTLAAALYAGKRIRETFPSIRQTMGGAIFSQELYPFTPNFHRFMEKASFLDAIFIGESEKLFLRYLQGELPGDKKVYTLDDIDGEVLDLDTLDLPDYSDFQLDRYPLLGAYTSRGCTYRCSFCAETVYWKKYHRKEVKKIADELEKMADLYKRRVFVLTDCLINPIVTPLAREIDARRSKVFWDVYLKVDDQVCSPEIALLWRKGGFYRARLGIESGSKNVLKAIDKRITVDQVKRALHSLAEAGIKTTTYWIAGHPGETEEDFRETLDLLEEIQDDIYEAECDPFRYFFTGQVKAEQWAREKGNRLLYPQEASDMLVTQTWVLNEIPTREIIYERGSRFKNHCHRLGIPNPYSYSEIQQADERWKRLHPNAVPPLLELNERNIHEYFDFDARPIIRRSTAHIKPGEDVDFNI